MEFGNVFSIFFKILNACGIVGMTPGRVVQVPVFTLIKKISALEFPWLLFGSENTGIR
jgi:hypothetical protein